jgi:hypothetical protein
VIHLWPIEVIKAINEPKKYAKTKKQTQAIEKFREVTGFTIRVDKKTGIEKGDRLC